MKQRPIQKGDKFVTIREVTVNGVVINNGFLVSCIDEEPKFAPLIGFGTTVVMGLEVHSNWHDKIFLPLDCLRPIDTL